MRIDKAIALVVEDSIFHDRILKDAIIFGDKEPDTLKIWPPRMDGAITVAMNTKFRRRGRSGRPIKADWIVATALKRLGHPKALLDPDLRVEAEQVVAEWIKPAYHKAIFKGVDMLLDTLKSYWSDFEGKAGKYAFSPAVQEAALRDIYLQIEEGESLEEVTAPASYMRELASVAARNRETLDAWLEGLKASYTFGAVQLGCPNPRAYMCMRGHNGVSAFIYVWNRYASRSTAALVNPNSRKFIGGTPEKGEVYINVEGDKFQAILLGPNTGSGLVSIIVESRSWDKVKEFLDLPFVTRLVRKPIAHPLESDPEPDDVRREFLADRARNDENPFVRAASYIELSNLA